MLNARNEDYEPKDNVHNFLKDARYGRIMEQQRR